jgi:hypothetical protein
VDVHQKLVDVDDMRTDGFDKWIVQQGFSSSIFGDVSFNSGKSNLTKRGKEELDEIASSIETEVNGWKNYLNTCNERVFENDVFVIRNIELYPDNTLTVFNRWGTIVYEVDRYGLDGQVFKGTKAVGGSSGEDLPIGTYFYTLRYVNAQGITKYRSGYLYLNK